jgi:hypothetical protein
MTEKELREQLSRLRALKRAKDTTVEEHEASAREIMRICREDSEDVEHLRRAIDLAIRRAKWMPAPADIFEALEATRGSTQDTSLERGCDACGWNGGWVVVMRGGYEGVGPCVCRRENRMDEREKRILEPTRPPVGSAFRSLAEHMAMPGQPNRTGRQ